jgi:hypothetical protein
MSKRKKIASVAFTGAAAATAVGMGVTPALAAGGTWNIDNGGTGYTGPVAGSNSTNATLNANGTQLTCKPGTASATGSVGKSTVSSTPAHLGDIPSANFGVGTACSYAGLFHFTAALTKTAGLYGSSYNAATGVTTGQIRDISAKLTGVSGTTCSATVTGAALQAQYNNTTHGLTIDPAGSSPLTVTLGAAGCPGLLTNGEKAGFNATYIFSPPITVTDP